MTDIDPRISLAIDNCFASKRWTRPADWMTVVRDLGLTMVEASADTECDPMYMGAEYIEDWIGEVRRCSERFGVRVANLYSGHGTYATLGLAHTDPRVRARFRDGWVKAQADTARRLGAGLGFFAHAVHDPALQDPAEYRNVMDTLVGDFADLARHAADTGLSYIGVEQMYSPNQPPWTIPGSRDLLRRVFALSGAPFYLTLDLGHMNGQQYFMKPSREQVEAWLDLAAAGARPPRIWLGPARAMEIFDRAAAGSGDRRGAVDDIMAAQEGYGHLFAAPSDGSVDGWLRELARWSPIIHLQQSDGKSSPHWPFSREYNDKGIIRGEDVIAAIASAYAGISTAGADGADGSDEAAGASGADGMPPPCGEVVLTLEPFIGTAANNYDALRGIGESVAYWRRFVPRDGMRLSEVVSAGLA